MKNLLIIGARGFGREVYAIALESVGYGEDFLVKGFLDDKSDALDGYKDYPPIISSCEAYEIQKDDVFICALGFPNMKKKYASIILEKGGKFINLIHKRAYIGKNTTLGTGCIVGREASISCDIKVGDFVTIQGFSAIGHDAVIGAWCHLNTYSFMGGFSALEDEATLQTGAILVPHKKVGRRSVLGANSVAIKNIKDDITAFGLPAQKVEW